MEAELIHVLGAAIAGGPNCLGTEEVVRDVGPILPLTLHVPVMAHVPVLEVTTAQQSPSDLLPGL